MPSDAEVNARIARLLSGEQNEAVAREGLANLEAFKPLRFSPPPQWLGGAIEQARQLMRERNYGAADQVVQNIAATQGQAYELGKYRDHVSWVERENGRKLSALAWMWITLMRSRRGQVRQLRAVGAPDNADDIELDRALERIERFAFEHYGVKELRSERGWAEYITYQAELLPSLWRHA